MSESFRFGLGFAGEGGGGRDGVGARQKDLPPQMDCQTDCSHQEVEVQIDCPQALVSRVIGAGGATIRDLQARSQARIWVKTDFPDGFPRKIVITGTQETTQEAARLVAFVLGQKARAPEHTERPAFGIQIASDLHIEFYIDLSADDQLAVWKRLLVPTSDTLALIGDIGILTSKRFKEQYESFITWCISRWSHVIVLTGNHEYYCSDSASPCTIEDCDLYLKSLSESRRYRNKLYFLQKDGITINGVTILGCTLWSFIPPEAREAVSESLNDYHLIYKRGSASPVTPFDTHSIFCDHEAWLRRTLGTITQGPVIILTHHTPSCTGTSAPYYEGPDRPTNHAFSSDLRGLIAEFPCIDFWCYGHTHYNNRQRVIQRPSEDGKESSCQLLSNQAGYKDNIVKLYSPQFVI